MTHGQPPQPYHKKCYRELYSPQCSVCSQSINGRYIKHPFFENEFHCVSHEATQASCFSCNKKEPLNSSGKETFTALLDGRSLCSICSGSIIMDSTEAVQLYKEIIDFMEFKLNLNMPQYIREVPILAVDIQALNENKNLYCQSHHGEAITRGLTMSTCGEIKHMRLEFGQIIPKIFKIDVVRDVTAILVLFGLPRCLFLNFQFFYFIFQYLFMHFRILTVYISLRNLNSKI
jgi:hypothetical protein